MQADTEYLSLLQELVDRSDHITPERTGTGATNLFGRQMRFDLSKEFPVLTTKKIAFKSVVTELLWFLKGYTNIKYLLQHGCTIWTDWRLKEYNAWLQQNGQPECSQAIFEKMILDQPGFAEQWGDIGKGYGHQWRNYGEIDDTFPYSQVKMQEGFDQIKWVINEIKTNPYSRRLVVSGWNPHEVDKVDLPPCHTLFQFFVEDGKLSCQLYQRSADTFLGVPFNIASYALLTILVARECGLALGEFVWTGGIVHLYSNHIEQAKLQLSRKPYQAPQLILPKGVSIFELEPDDIKLEGYQYHPAIPAPVAV